MNDRLQDGFEIVWLKNVANLSLYLATHNWIKQHFPSTFLDIVLSWSHNKQYCRKRSDCISNLLVQMLYCICYVYNIIIINCTVYSTCVRTLYCTYILCICIYSTVLYMCICACVYKHCSTVQYCMCRWVSRLVIVLYSLYCSTIPVYLCTYVMKVGHLRTWVR